MPLLGWSREAEGYLCSTSRWTAAMWTSESLCQRVGPCMCVCEREAEGTAGLTTNANRRLIAVGGFGDLHKKGNLRLGRSRRRRHNAASEGITSATAHFQRISAAEREMRIIDERDKLHCRDIKGGREMRRRCWSRDASLSARPKLVFPTREMH